MILQQGNTKPYIATAVIPHKPFSDTSDWNRGTPQQQGSVLMLKKNKAQ